MLSQKQPDGWYHPVAYVTQSLTIHECNYHSTKQEFLALKWVIAEQFQEYLYWKPFVVKTNNNSLTYILTTPNLDTTWHHWVEALAGFTFSIEYQKGRDSAVADALSHVASKLNAEDVNSILDGVTIGTAGRADAHDPVVAEANERIHKQAERNCSPSMGHSCMCEPACNRLGSYNKKIPYSKLWWSGFPPIKYGIWNISWGTMPSWKRVWPSLASWRNSCSIKVPSITTILWLESWRKLCGL